MATMDTPTVAEFIAVKASSVAAKRRQARQVKAKATNQALPSSRVFVAFQAMLRVILHVAGFASLTFGAFQWCTPVGYVVAGISFFALSWLTTDSAPTSGTGPQGPTMRG